MNTNKPYLPKFDSPSALEDSPWKVYLKLLYGEASIKDPSAFPIHMESFKMLRSDYLQAAGLNYSTLRSPDCPHRSGQLFEQLRKGGLTLLPSPPIMLVYHNVKEMKPLESDTWIEVMHRVRVDASEAEDTGYWMYHLPGSGVFYNLRKTIAFRSRHAAISHFLGKHIKCHDCEGHYPAMFKKAKKMGYTSIQFVHENPIGCEQKMIELVDVSHSGRSVCLPHFHGGKGHSRCPCKCSEENSQRIANCELNCPPAREDIRTNTTVQAHVQSAEDIPLWSKRVQYRFNRSAALHAAGALKPDLPACNPIPSTPRNPSVEGVTVATFNAARFEFGTPHVLGKELASVNVDVIAVQEDIGALDRDGTLQTFLHIPGFNIVSSCTAEQLAPSVKAYNWGGRVLVNTLHVRLDKWEAVSAQGFTISDRCSVPRCAALADLRMKKGVGIPRTIRVANTQLCGGQYEDVNWQQLKEEKITEVHTLTARNPDLVLGDMNSYPNTREAEQYDSTGLYSSYLRAADHNLASEYLAWSSSASAALRADSYTLLLGDEPIESSVHGGMTDQIWFRSGQFLNSGLDNAAIGSDHRLIRGTLSIVPEGPQVTHGHFVPLLLLPGMAFLITVLASRWRARAPRGAGAVSVAPPTSSPSSTQVCACAMFFLKGLCHTLLPLCFAAWMRGSSPLEMICYAAAAARAGGLLGNVCWGAVIDVCMAPGVASALAHMAIALGSLVMVQGVGDALLGAVLSQFLIAFGCSAETPLTQHVLASSGGKEALGAQFAYMQIGGYVGGLYASVLFMAGRLFGSATEVVLQAAYLVVLSFALLTPLALFVCGAFKRPDGVPRTQSALWECWQVTPLYWLIVTQGILSATAYDVGSFMLASLASASQAALSGELSAVQCVCSAIGSFFFGWWSDQLASGGDHRARISAGAAGCVSSMVAVAALSLAQRGGDGGWMLIMVCLLAAKSFSEDAAYVGTTRPLLVVETHKSCAAAAVAMKNVLDCVVAAFSGPLILFVARCFGYDGLGKPEDGAGYMGHSIGYIYITLRVMELAIYRVMRDHFDLRCAL